MSGESRYRLGPLRLPGPGDAGLSGSEAVTLFADRARMSDPGFSLDSSSGPEVARLVARLDGMPLAIELAAARVEALGLQGSLTCAAMDPAAGRGQPEAADRHRTLRGHGGWSYRLLGEQEQRVFRCFRSSWPVHPGGRAGGSRCRGGALRVRLVDCSLLTPPRPGVDGRARYLMLQTLRGYAAERLAADERSWRRPAPGWPPTPWRWPSGRRLACRPAGELAAARRWTPRTPWSTRAVVGAGARPDRRAPAGHCACALVVAARAPGDRVPAADRAAGRAAGRDVVVHGPGLARRPGPGHR